MPRKRHHSAPLAIALDGTVLLNLTAQLAAPEVARIAATLGVKAADVVVATRLDAARSEQARARLDDAVAETAARLLGEAGSSASRRAATKRPKKR